MIPIAISVTEQERANQNSAQLRLPEIGAGGEVYEETGEALFRAGNYVAPGAYIEIETGRCVILTARDYLPARLDGKVAWYRPQRASIVNYGV